MIAIALKYWAEQHHSTFERAVELFNDSCITPWEILNAYLQEEGIYGYTTKILALCRELLQERSEEEC